MLNYISVADYKFITRHLNQTSFIQKLQSEGVIDKLFDTYYLQEEDEAERKKTIKKDFNGNEKEYSRWENAEYWITFENIDDYIDEEYFKKRRICFIESEFGAWIAMNSCNRKEITKELFDILFGYKLTEEDIKNFENGCGISVDCWT